MEGVDEEQKVIDRCIFLNTHSLEVIRSVTYTKRQLYLTIGINPPEDPHEFAEETCYLSVNLSKKMCKPKFVLSFIIVNLHYEADSFLNTVFFSVRTGTYSGEPAPVRCHLGSDS